MESSTRKEARQERQKLSMEQYKAFREHVVLLVNDRIAINRLLLAIATVILGGEGLVLKDYIADGAGPFSRLALVLLGVACATGALVSFTWYRWNKSHKVSLRIRYDILREIEVSLPHQPFARELELRKERGYVAVSDVIGSLSLIFLSVFLLQLPALAFLAWRSCGG